MLYGEWYPRRTRLGLIEAYFVWGVTVRQGWYPRRTRLGLIEAITLYSPLNPSTTCIRGVRASASLKRVLIILQEM